MMRIVTLYMGQMRWSFMMGIVQDYAGPQPSPVDLERIDNLQSFTLNNAHYYCETADITRPFPSSHPVSDPSWEFVWNRWMTQPFRELELANHCPHLLQVLISSFDSQSKSCLWMASSCGCSILDFSSACAQSCCIVLWVQYLWHETQSKCWKKSIAINH